MSKLKIVGAKDDQKAILSLLSRSGCFEVSKAQKASDDTKENSTLIETLKNKQAKLSVAIDYLAKLKEEGLNANNLIKKGKLEEEVFELEKDVKTFARLEVSYNELEEVKKSEVELIKICDSLQEISFSRNELNSSIKELKDLKAELAPFASVTMPLSSVGDTQTASVLLASNPNLSDKEIIEKMGALVEEYPVDNGALWGILCKKDDRPFVVRKLLAIGFEICTLKHEKKPQKIIDESEAEIANLEKQNYAKLREGLGYINRLTHLKALFDISELDLEHILAEANFSFCENTVTIEGWTPFNSAEAIKDKLVSEIKTVSVEIGKVEKGDEPPSLFVNSKLTEPFVAVPKGYAPPTYGELDPTAVMSIFFFIFFGIMLADAGYGLVMAIVGLAVGLFVKKFEVPMKRMILMFGICGLSGVIFGLLFGGIFGIEFISQNHYLWFNPLEEPIMMLALSIGLGIAHLLTAYTLKTIVTIREGLKGENKKNKILVIFHGLFDSLFMYTLFAGVGMFALSMIIEDSNFPFVTLFIVLLGITVLGIILTGGRRANGIGGKIAGGLGGVYRLINVFSDVLSYARLFGLAIASGAIAMAFNQIGSLLFAFNIPIGDGWLIPLGYIIGAIILIVLHAFNFLLSALAAYVHNIRLQYVEFFGKFYDGNGRHFEPLGEKTKYVRFVER